MSADVSVVVSCLRELEALFHSEHLTFEQKNYAFNVVENLREKMDAVAQAQRRGGSSPRCIYSARAKAETAKL